MYSLSCSGLVIIGLSNQWIPLPVTSNQWIPIPVTSPPYIDSPDTCFVFKECWDN